MSELDLFRRCLDHVLKSEGGYVNHPNDKGGATNFGITQKGYNAIRAIKMLPPRSVKEITIGEVESIYAGEYWNPAKCRELPQKVAIVHFDAAVNHGVRNAANLLQRACGLPEEAALGPKAIEAAAAPGIPEKYLAVREQFYRDIVAAKPDQAVFLKGWLNRIKKLQSFIRGL